MIGKTNSMSGGDIKPEVVKVQLKTNQSSHTDIVGAKITVNYADVSEVYTWEGNDISIKIPPYLSYTISVNDIDGYKTPDIYNSMAIGGTTKSITLEYKCTILTVEMDDNQPSYNDVSTATATISSSGMTTKTISNGNSVKVPTGNACTITWSSVGGYKTPDSQTFTASGTSVTKTGTYETEVLTVNVTSNINLPSSFTITVSGVGSQNTATKTYKIPYGYSYTVSGSYVPGYVTPAAQTFTASNESRTLNMSYLKDIEYPIDLSMQDIYGNSISGRTTANCYVVKEAGYYSIPLVYGNAIKNGSSNTPAYTKIDGTYTHDFVNYKDIPISSPYIETDTNTSVSSVELTMADTSGVFGEMSIMNGTPCKLLKFKIENIPATGANGVVSVLDGDGVVMWSWHIWVWADDLTPIEIQNKTNVKYYILPVNLATKKDSKSTGNMYNWFYQWGRHVPSLPPASYSNNEDATNYGVKTFANSSTSATTYGEGIRNPNIMYYHKSSSNKYNWFGESSYFNLWDAACIKAGASDNNVVKTVYDPCPAGFKIPNGNTFSRFSKTNVVGKFSNGWKFKRSSNDTVGVFFPATGRRTPNSSGVSYLTSDGYVWVSSAYHLEYSYYLYFDSSSVNPQSTYGDRYKGYSVRPVQE